MKNFNLTPNQRLIETLLTAGIALLLLAVFMKVLFF